MRLLLLADLHFGKSRESTTNSDIIRQANDKAEEELSRLIPEFNKQKLDLVIQMGDLIRDVQDKSEDYKLLNQAYRLLTKIKHSQIHLIGNHELWGFASDEVLTLKRNYGFEGDFWGSKIFNGVQIVWIDQQLDGNGLAFLEDEKLEWLAKGLDASVPSLIFSHFSIVPVDSTSSFYWVGQEEKMTYKNSDQIIKVLKDKKVFACINSHLHIASYKTIAGIHFLTIPAFSENIAGEEYPENNPGIYSILEVNEGKFILRNYSRNYVFNSVELKGL